MFRGTNKSTIALRWSVIHVLQVAPCLSGAFEQSQSVQREELTPLDSREYHIVVLGAGKSLSKTANGNIPLLICAWVRWCWEKLPYWYVWPALNARMEGMSLTLRTYSAICTECMD